MTTARLLLNLPLRGDFFDQVAAGVKVEEYRLCTPYWRTRIEGKTFDGVLLTRGYPAADDEARRLLLPWRGYTLKTIRHDHFGPKRVRVFAIRLETTT